MTHVYDLKIVPNLERFRVQKCTEDIRARTTGVLQGTDKTSAYVLYVPYDLSKGSTSTSTISTSTEQLFINGFSYGEVILCVLFLSWFMIWGYTHIRKINV